MSRPHDGQHRSSSMCSRGNGGRFFFWKRSFNFASKHGTILRVFETTLAKRLKELHFKPKGRCTTLNLRWMCHALQVLRAIHNDFRSLMSDLQCPLSKWDESWIKQYLGDTVHVLDICIALQSERSRLENGMLLARYALHLLDGTDKEELLKAKDTLKELLDSINNSKIRNNQVKIDHCPRIIHEMAKTLQPVKAGSGKHKALNRAIYGVKVASVFICNAVVCGLLRVPCPLLELTVSDQFLWADSFKKLQEDVNKEIRGWTLNGPGMKLEEVRCWEVSTERLITLIEFFIESKEQEAASEKEAASDQQQHITVPVIEGAVYEAQLTTLEHAQNTVERAVCKSREMVSIKTESYAHEMNCTKEEPESKLGMPSKKESEVNKESSLNEEAESQTELPCGGRIPEQEVQLSHAIQEFRQSSELICESSEAFKKEVDEFFQIILDGRNALLDNIRLSDNPNVFPAGGTP